LNLKLVIIILIIKKKKLNNNNDDFPGEENDDNMSSTYRVNIDKNSIKTLCVVEENKFENDKNVQIHARVVYSRDAQNFVNVNGCNNYYICNEMFYGEWSSIIKLGVINNKEEKIQVKNYNINKTESLKTLSNVKEEGETKQEVVTLPDTIIAYVDHGGKKKKISN